MHREEGVSWGHMQEKGHRGHMEVGEGEGDNHGVDGVEKVSSWSDSQRFRDYRE